MCAIYGAFGRELDGKVLERIRERCRDRGRDGGALRMFNMGDDMAALGSWRATPTTEAQAAPPQPYDGIVHNGTIANDLMLGNMPGYVDSLVLPKIINRADLEALVKSLEPIQGSYALGIAGLDTVYLATNYKPIHYVAIEKAVYFASMERHLLPELGWAQRPQRLAPYTAIDLSTGRTKPLLRERSLRTLVIASAGLDSTTAAYMLARQGHAVSLLHFDYGCHAGSAEKDRIERIAEDLDCPFIVLPLDYSRLAGGSALLTKRGIRDGVAGAEFAHEWVPARNLLMIATAVAYAEANGYGTVALGNNLEEAGAYPDNEEEFTNLLDMALDYAVHDGGQVRLISPVGHLMKHEIVREGRKHGVPFHLTWSCYRGGRVHCGLCGPCFMRKTAFERNGWQDPVFAPSGQPSGLSYAEGME